MKPISCFKAYDLRGRIPDELNDDVAYRVARDFVILTCSSTISRRLRYLALHIFPADQALGRFAVRNGSRVPTNQRYASGVPKCNKDLLSFDIT